MTLVFENIFEDLIYVNCSAEYESCVKLCKNYYVKVLIQLKQLAFKIIYYSIFQRLNSLIQRLVLQILQNVKLFDSFCILILFTSILTPFYQFHPHCYQSKPHYLYQPLLVPTLLLMTDVLSAIDSISIAHSIGVGGIAIQPRFEKKCRFLKLIIKEKTIFH